MKFKNIIFFIVFGLFVIEPTKVKSTDIVSDILGTALEQGKKSKLEREKWGIPKKDLAGLKSKEIKSLISGNIISSEYNVPLGVWVCREASRKSLSEKPLSFGSQELMFKYAKELMRRKFSFDIDLLLDKSKLLKEKKEQRKLSEWN